MQTRAPLATVQSTGWNRTSPLVSVIVATHNRADFLHELAATLESQEDAPSFEVLFADDGSQDSTWTELEHIVSTTSLPMQALRLPRCGGPSVPRNTAVAASRGELIAFTDDDCLPAPGWLAALAPLASEHVVQGMTLPADRRRHGPWDRTITITALTGLWESCNLSLSRRVFEAAGGFPTLGLVPRRGRGFGEDAVLGAAAARIAPGYWAPHAVVHHRWLGGDFRSHVESMRRLEAMPALVAQIPELRERSFATYFRSRRSAACDLAVVAVGTSLVTRRLAPLAATVPWLVLLTGGARRREPRNLAPVVAGEAVSDLVGLAALVRGSARSKTLLL